MSEVTPTFEWCFIDTSRFSVPPTLSSVHRKEVKISLRYPLGKYSELVTDDLLRLIGPLDKEEIKMMDAIRARMNRVATIPPNGVKTAVVQDEAVVSAPGQKRKKIVAGAIRRPREISSPPAS